MTKPLLHRVKKILTGLVGGVGISCSIALSAQSQQPLRNNSTGSIRPVTPLNFY